MGDSKELKKHKSEETCLNKLASAFIDIALCLIESGDLGELENTESNITPSVIPTAVRNCKP